MSRVVDLVLRRLSREGLPRFLAGDSFTWVVIALVAYMLRRSRQAGSPVVSSVELQAGERYLVTLTDPK